MSNVKQTAERATMQNFLNCYLRESENYTDANQAQGIETIFSQLTDCLEKVIECPLSHQNVYLIVPVKYWSQTGRHLFNFPLYVKKGDEAPQPIDYITLTSLLVNELQLEQGREGAEDELVLRVILSCQNIKKYLEAHQTSSEHDENLSYIEAEQSLLFGHLLHPTPKSKQGMTGADDDRYGPEMKGAFQLHYFHVKKSELQQKSMLPVSIKHIIMQELRADPSLEESFLADLEIQEEWELVPTHPLQAKHLIEQHEVKAKQDERTLVYLGPIGPLYTATSSFRTVYRQGSDYMFKFSVPVKITNSLRYNQPHELERGVEVARLLDTRLGRELAYHYPHFQVIKDPAYMNVPFDREDVKLDVVVRENPFKGNSTQTYMVAGLCQDGPDGRHSSLHKVISDLAHKKGQTHEHVSLDWFKAYLDITLDPLLWLFETYGIALEAHQQNSVIKLKDGFPHTFYYRDNQGYYFSETHADKLRELLPDLNRHSDTICSAAIAEERFRYYFIFNHIFGLINSFGVNGLISEQRLLDVFREKLRQHHSRSKGVADLLASLLNDEKLPCKANLLTRFYDMDELVGSLEDQSVYTLVSNPIAEKAGITNG
ncbi:IucA/IucC family siderophore biosynthesis protein [Thalassobacillus sp. CUG 92003]|uniref:IucA/IucC family protein n=1 Tax=Thalassobacillus sp. CUG 92003 TaxID=2736641 RepID=UPI0015E64F80|nr:IucA/IucC family protein [Thalassobacillus sp. CUG 92003]